MNPLSQKLEGISSKLADLLFELDEIIEQIDQSYAVVAAATKDVDRRALASISTDLMWAVENTSVVSQHLIGKCLEDDMGYGS